MVSQYGVIKVDYIGEVINGNSALYNVRVKGEVDICRRKFIIHKDPEGRRSGYTLTEKETGWNASRLKFFATMDECVKCCYDNMRALNIKGPKEFHDFIEHAKKTAGWKVIADFKQTDILYLLINNYGV